MFIILSFLHFKNAYAEEVHCKELLLDTKKILKSIRENIKISRDIHYELTAYESGIEKLNNCPKEKKDKTIAVGHTEMARFRKFKYAPDRSANLSEEQCSEVNVPTEHMPKNANQNQLSWCFAWPSTDLVSFHEQVPLSAYDVAFQYHNNDDVRAENALAVNYKGRKTTDMGGNVTTAMKVAMNPKGVCLESETDYLNSDWKKNGEAFRLLSDSPKSFLESICSSGLYNVTPFKELDLSLVNLLEKLSGDKRMAAFLDLTCKKRHVVKSEYRNLVQYIDRPGVTKEGMMDKLDKVLNKHEPIAMTYDSMLLYNGVNYQGKNADHSSTIIGRKFNKSSGQCEYLIKNSWGNDEVCTKAATVRCEKGNYWVSRTALKNNLFEINWLEKKPAKPSIEIQK